jgi:ABC-type multidrug transport system ATPase subunit
MGSFCAVCARGLTKCFGDVVALDGVDLDVVAGQIHGVVGPNGAGKTTLFGLLLGLAVPDRGSTCSLSGSDATGQVHTPYGGASNPLWQFDGNVDLLPATSKG